MTFDQWKKRPVYVVQCMTWSLAVSLGLMTYAFRLLPAYRNREGLAVRRIVAEHIRLARARRRGLVVQPDMGKQLWLWSYVGTAGVFGGKAQGADVREAASAIFTSGSGTQLFAIEHGIPIEAMDELPGNIQVPFSLDRPWGRLILVLAPTA